MKQQQLIQEKSVWSVHRTGRNEHQTVNMWRIFSSVTNEVLQEMMFVHVLLLFFICDDAGMFFMEHLGDFDTVVQCIQSVSVSSS